MRKKREKKKLFEFEGGFYYYTGKIFDLIALNTLWLLCCLPLVTIGASTTALYYTIIKSIKGERGYLSEEFFKAFRMNLKNSTVIWMVVVLLSFLFQLNIGIIFKFAEGNTEYILISVYLVLLLGVTGILLYGFPALASLDMSAGWIIKLSLYMTVRYFLTTLILLGTLIGSVAIIYYCPYFIIILPALVCTFSSGRLEKVLKNHMPKIAQ